MKWHIVHGVDL